MLKPIINSDNLSLENLIIFFKFKFLQLSKIVLIALVFYTLFFFLKPDKYTSKVSFYTNYQDSMQSSLLTMVPGFMSGGLAGNTLDFSISNYISSEKFLFDVVNKEYYIDENNTTLKEHWGSDYNNFLLLNPLSIASRINRYFMLSRHLSVEDKKESFSATLLYNSIEYSENRRTKMHHISLEIQDSPELAEQIMNNIYSSILSYSKEIVNSKASEKRIFVSNRLDEIKSDLERYENELLNFMIQNKDIKSSPTLSLQQQRLQKNISLHEQLYFTLSDQLELAKINEKDNTTSIFLLDSPSVNPIKSGLSLAKGGLLIFLLTYIVGYAYFLYHFREKLFLYDLEKKEMS